MKNKTNNKENKLDNIILTPIEIKAIEIFFKENIACSSVLRRNLEIGFFHASKILDSLEDKHIINKSTGLTQRKLLISKEDFEILKNKTI